ncbi:MAG: protease pro-enzyme activation domain-containing protein [Acidobacteriota bacterium]|nr:protease pro-enzyme activation domain-containing protein [Acidobacteriota bacterium]
MAALLLVNSGAAQQRGRITGRIDGAQRVTLHGHIHPRATAENDVGRVAPEFKVSYVTIALSKTAAQQADLESLLAEQQNPQSPNYHRWLTPGEYADRFGASSDDLNQMTEWLRGQGLTIADVAQGRDWIAVSGDAAHIENVFGTELRAYAVDGATHFANASEPSVPAALGNVVLSIRGLHDFRLRPANLKPHAASPHYTSSHGNHYLAPNDFAALYDILPAYTSNISGAGQKLAVAGQTDIDTSDIQLFQSTYNLPANLPQVLLVTGSPDPGTSQGDLGEADLDLEWSGAVARNATIIYVNSTDVLTSVQYAIDNNLAPVLSLSYGSCELENLQSDAKTIRAIAQKGNAEGITWVNATGDNGAADCADASHPGLAVDLPSSIPEVTGVGGTRLQEGTGQYWNAVNDANGASVLGYIPETSWNDSAADGSPSSSGGGASVYFTKPAWQSGPGVPADNARHVPDIAFSASADHDAYLVFSGGPPVEAYGGTSAPTPAMAGIVTLLNQYLVLTGKQKTPGVGNLNQHLYALAQSAPSVFHDVTTGNNTVTTPCTSRTQVCNYPAVGYNAGAGYDQVTGLGSLDVWQLMSCWSGTCAVVTPPSASLSLIDNMSSVGLQDHLTLTATAAALNGGATPVGSVVFTAGTTSGTTSLGSATLTGSAGLSTATIMVTGNQLPSGSSTITATWNGSSTSVPVTSSVTVNVRTTGSSGNGTPTVSGVTDAAAYGQVYSPGMILSVFGSKLSPSVQSAGSVPLPLTMAGVEATVNGQAAPLYYVSPTQLNLQIPYETAAGAATLAINNNGTLTSKTFTVSADSPAIFTDASQTIVPDGSVARGGIASLYMTGTGAVTPAIATGSAPLLSTPLGSLPAPQNVVVSVGDAQASTTCAGGCFAGIPYGLVGVTQINFQVAANTPLGKQPVIVTINGVASPAANINVTN